ncbi:hypothetical protein FHS57_005494 [Runella defluvii]|uniref:DUF937 domain-containing protein n=1 Tax=Runella defluvii TaxID=370973 RepID=A0A7W5ZSV1_9BACT|nr:hypothetical protein [Runella defluvii]MBB3841466.1 hypothetical protein [Runella defluvii]
MLEQLMSLIQDNSQDAIVNNPAIPNQNNNAAMQTVFQSVVGGLQNEAQGGNLSGLMGLLSGQGGQGGSLMNNPIVAGIAQNAIGSLMEKFGLSNSAAGNIIAQVLPGVLSSMISKTSNPNDNSMDFGGIMGSLLGGQAPQQQQQGGFDFNQIGYALADGKLDMNDVMRIGGSLLGGNSGNAGGAGGGLGGLLGGLFGK